MTEKKTTTRKKPSAKFTAADLRSAHKRGFDAASRGNRYANWSTRTTDADAELRGNIQLLRNRFRDLMRNNAWAQKAIQVIKTNTVGSGILPQFANPDTQALWEIWGDTTICDIEGRHDFYGIENLVMGATAADGDAFIVKRLIKRTDQNPIGLQIQVLEADYLDITKDGPTRSGGLIMSGIQFSKDNEREGYWFYKNHPGQALGFRFESSFYKADDVIHVYRQDRPGQSSGYPWGACVMNKMRDLADWQDNKLYRAKITACFAAFVYDAFPSGATEDNGDLITQLEPGNVEYLPAGKQVAFADPPTASGEEGYVADMVREIAGGFGISYEALSGNLSGVNFSSGRMGWLEFQRNIDSWRWTMLIPHLCEGVARWFQDQVDLIYNIAPSPVTWTPPRREMIDPAKELAAFKDAIRNGFMSLSEVIRTLGYDPTKTLTELSNDFSLLDTLGLVLDTDPRQDAKRMQVEVDEKAVDNQSELDNE